MASYQATIRTACKDQVDTDKNGYVITTLETEETYYPKENLEDLASHPRAKFVCVGIGSNRNRERRQLGTLLSIPVQVALQQKVDPTNTAYIDQLVEVAEQIMASLEDDELVSGSNYTWERTEPLTDENGLIFSYEQLTVDGIFQSVFTVFYQYIIRHPPQSIL